jgi:MGT family glycosyltransferase
MALSFLFTSWGNSGNLTPLLTAARRLRDRGHRVRILGKPDHREEAEKAGLDTLLWRLRSSIPPPNIDGCDPAWAEIRTLFAKVTFGAAIDHAADTMDAIRADPVDAIVTSDLLAGPVIAAEAAGIPCALLAPHVSVRPLDGVPTGITGLIPCKNPEYETEERATRVRMVRLMCSYLPTLNRARAAFKLRPLNHIFDHYDRADRLFMGISSAFDFPAKSLPANLRYIGPLLDQPAWVRPWATPWLKQKVRPRILVSLGTSFQNQGEVLRRIVTALGGIDGDAIVTLGPAMERETIEAPANVSIVHSAPHDAVMKEVSLVVTHGGHGTVTRSLVNGVPLLVIPMGRDQAGNAARIVARGAGLALTEEGATVEQIASAIGRLTSEPHFTAAAVRLGQAIAPDVTSPIFVGEMEFVATRRWHRTA